MKKVAPRKNYTKSTRTFIFMTVVVLIISVVYGYIQYQELSMVNLAIANGQTQLRDLQTAEKQISATYATIKEVYENNFDTIRTSIEQIYPSEELYTELTRTLDKYVLLNNQTTLNPIFMSDLRFSSPRIDKESDYAILPFTLTLSTSRDNFDKFLAYIESSGSLEDGVRLMDIRSISLNLPSGEVSTFGSDIESDIPLMNVSMSLNAYFQIPPDIK